MEKLRVSDFKRQDLASTVWALATANKQNAKPFALLTRAAELRLGNYQMLEHANTAEARVMA